jgi:hypothetical protein
VAQPFGTKYDAWLWNLSLQSKQVFLRQDSQLSSVLVCFGLLVPRHNSESVGGSATAIKKYARLWNSGFRCGALADQNTIGSITAAEFSSSDNHKRIDVTSLS